MSRVIKFRVWDINKKIFIPPHAYSIITTDFNAFGVIINDWEEYVVGEYFYKDSQVIEQFTGLHDKNGKEIYEGDIIHSKFSDGRDCNHVIEWKETGFVAKFYSDKLDNGSLFTHGWIIEFNKVIIGNIHENPELLK